MTVVQTGVWAGWPNGVVVELQDDAAVALFSAIDAYRRETGRHDADVDPLYMPVGGLRTVAECDEMGRAYDIYKGRVKGDMGWALAIYQKYNMLKSSNARPSTTSPHVAGRSADIAPQAFYNWMLIHGPAYGWHFTLLNAGDPRHAEYKPGTATAALNVHSLPGGTVPPPPPPKEPHMFILNATALDGGINGRWLLAPGYLHGFVGTEWDDWGQYLQIAGMWVFTPPTLASFQSIVAAFTTQRWVGYRGDNDLLDRATLPDVVAAIVKAIPAGGGSGTVEIPADLLDKITAAAQAGGAAAIEALSFVTVAQPKP